MDDKIVSETSEEVTSLATELLKEQKLIGRRWFVVAVIELVVILLLTLGITGMFMWYISLPTEEYSIAQESEDSGNNQIIGGDYNVNSAESDV